MYKLLLGLGFLTFLIYTLNTLLLRLIVSIKHRFGCTNSKPSKCQELAHTKNDVIKIGLLTNELSPWCVYGGVATWICSFINMFKKNKMYKIIPIFLAYNDDLPKEAFDKYPNLRMIYTPSDISKCFCDIDICVNNLWISLDTIIKIKECYPKINIVSVCHSLIRMEHITNMGSQYTNNFNDQEITFQHSDWVILISNAEKKYYDTSGYDKFNANTQVIYNSYTPKYDEVSFDVDYTNNNIGYIGRHVPRKRPELPLKAVEYLKNTSLTVYNMGVDYDKYDNAYWRKLEKEYYKNLKIIPFTTDKKVKQQFLNNIGIACVPGIYEPFGYTGCEMADAGFPIIVQNIDGPKEIFEGFEDSIYFYEVDIDNYNQDIINFSKVLEKVLKIPPDTREKNAIKARKALDRFRPEIISQEWIGLFSEITT